MARKARAKTITVPHVENGLAPLKLAELPHDDRNWRPDDYGATFKISGVGNLTGMGDHALTDELLNMHTSLLEVFCAAVLNLPQLRLQKINYNIGTEIKTDKGT